MTSAKRNVNPISQVLRTGYEHSRLADGKITLSYPVPLKTFSIGSDGSVIKDFPGPNGSTADRFLLPVELRGKPAVIKSITHDSRRSCFWLSLESSKLKYPCLIALEDANYFHLRHRFDLTNSAVIREILRLEKLPEGSVLFPNISLKKLTRQSDGRFFFGNILKRNTADSSEVISFHIPENATNPVLTRLQKLSLSRALLTISYEEERMKTYQHLMIEFGKDGMWRKYKQLSDFHYMLEKTYKALSQTSNISFIERAFPFPLSHQGEFKSGVRRIVSSTTFSPSRERIHSSIGALFPRSVTDVFIQRARDSDETIILEFYGESDSERCVGEIRITSTGEATIQVDRKKSLFVRAT